MFFASRKGSKNTQGTKNTIQGTNNPEPHVPQIVSACEINNVFTSTPKSLIQFYTLPLTNMDHGNQTNHKSPPTPPNKGGKNMFLRKFLFEFHCSFDSPSKQVNDSTQLWDGVMEWRILLVALPSDEMFVDGRVSRTLSKCSSSFERSGNDEASGKSPMLMFKILKVAVRLCFNFGKQPHVVNYRPSQVISKPPEDESHQTSNLQIRKMNFCCVVWWHMTSTPAKATLIYYHKHVFPGGR